MEYTGVYKNKDNLFDRQNRMNQTKKPRNLLQSGVSGILPKDFLEFISRFNGFKGGKNLKINLSSQKFFEVFSEILYHKTGKKSILRLGILCFAVISPSK